MDKSIHIDDKKKDIEVHNLVRIEGVEVSSSTEKLDKVVETTKNLLRDNAVKQYLDMKKNDSILSTGRRFI